MISKYFHSIYHMSAVHKGHLECMNATVDLYSPIMRSTFGINVLIGVDALNALFRTNTQLARNFLGYFIDFVVFREEHKELATKVQVRLRFICNISINTIPLPKSSLPFEMSCSLVFSAMIYRVNSVWSG